MRTVIDIPDDQIEALRQISERANASRAEVIRRAIADYVARQEPDVGDDAFGVWQERKGDALEIEDAIRSEWSR